MSLASGEVWCWGWGDKGQLGDILLSGDPDQPGLTWTKASGLAVRVEGPELPAFDLVETGGHFTCARSTSDHIVWCWGANHLGQLGRGTLGEVGAPSPVVGLGPVDALSTGRDHACAVSAGRVWCWGGNGFGMLGDGTALDRATPVRVLDL